MSSRPTLDTLVLRPSTPDDWPALCRVYDLARPLELQGSCDPRAFVPLARETEADELAESSVVVACLDDEVVGFVAVLRAYIGWLYVDPAQHRRGIGRALLARALSLAGDDAWTLVMINNHGARALYESAGFSDLETFEASSAGHACLCVKLGLDAPPADDAAPAHSRQT